MLQMVSNREKKIVIKKTVDTVVALRAVSVASEIGCECLLLVIGKEKLFYTTVIAHMLGVDSAIALPVFHALTGGECHQVVPTLRKSLALIYGVSKNKSMQ